MLPEEFKEKTGILSETAYLAANAIYMADENGNKWLNNSDYCAALVRSPKMLIELIGKMSEIIAEKENKHRAEIDELRLIQSNLTIDLRHEKEQNNNLKNTLLNVKNLAEQIIKEV